MLECTTHIIHIYLLTSPSGKYYVGQTNELLKRWRCYKILKKSLSRQPHLYNALKKYGPNNFTYEIIDICYNQDEADDAEKYWIIYHNSIENGYNIKDGGKNGCGITENGRKILSLKSKLYWENMDPKRKKELVEIVRQKNIGFKWSDEARRKLSLSRTGQKTWNKGIPHSKEHIEKIKNSMNTEIVKKKLGWRKGKPLKKEEIDSQRNSHKYFVYTMISPDGKIYKDTSVVRLVQTIFKECGVVFIVEACRRAALYSKKGFIKKWKIYREKYNAI